MLYTTDVALTCTWSLYLPSSSMRADVSPWGLRPRGARGDAVWLSRASDPGRTEVVLTRLTHATTDVPRALATLTTPAKTRPIVTVAMTT